MKKTLKLAVVIAGFGLIAGTLAACSAPELENGYQFGDTTKLAMREQDEVKQAIKDYCDKNRDSAIRYAALNIIRLKLPLVPENGICG